MLTSIKQKVLTAGAFSLLSLGSLALSASPTYAVALNFSTWTPIGNATAGTQPIITTGSSALETGGGADSLEAALGIPSNSLVTDDKDINSPTQGSAIGNSLTASNANDIFSFNLSLTGDSRDRAFVSITNAGISNTQILDPALTSFSYTFPTAGAYDIAIGAVDTGDTITPSQLVVSNGNIQAVPEPTSVISSLIAVSCGATLRKRFGKKA
jgi:hypothetical protein